MPILSAVLSEQLFEVNQPNIPIATSIRTSVNAFTIVNTDNLLTYGKPNAIVRPIRRRDPSEGRDNEDNVDDNFNLDKNTNTKSNNELGNFTKELDLKLKRLQKDTKKNSSLNVNIFYT